MCCALWKYSNLSLCLNYNLIFIRTSLLLGTAPLRRWRAPKVWRRLPHPLTNRAFLLCLLQNNRDTQAPKALKVGVTDRDRIPEGDAGIFGCVRQPGSGKQHRRSSTRNAKGPRRRLSSSVKHVIWVGVYTSDCLTRGNYQTPPLGILGML